MEAAFKRTWRQEKSHAYTMSVVLGSPEPKSRRYHLRLGMGKWFERGNESGLLLESAAGMKLAPRGKATAFLAVNALISGTAATLAPIISGLLADGRE